MASFSFSRALAVLLFVGLSAAAQAQSSLNAPASHGATKPPPTSTTTSTTAAPTSGLGLPATLPSAAPRAPVQNAAEAADAAPAREADPTADTAPRTPRRAPVPPNQFQRFVQESTGRQLAIFGAELFDAAPTYTPDTALPPPAEYALGSGDEVRVQIWGAVDYSGSHTLDRNGQITLPKVGVVALAGVPVRKLEAVLRGQIAKVFTNFEVNANLGRLRSIQIYVVGQAQQPGAHTVSSLSTLVNALFASGGPSANGSMRNIQLKRAGRTMTTLDLYDFIALGDKGRDVALQSGDVIVIPSAGPRVAVTGALDQAAIYELKPGSNTVGDMLSLGGGLPMLADPRKAVLERIAPLNTPPREVQELTLDAVGQRLPLRDGDVLTLLDISPAFSNAVTLQGAVAAPLRHRWFEGMRILDLIPEQEALITSDYYRRKNLLVQNTEVAKDTAQSDSNRVRGLSDQINWDYAVIERLNRKTLSTDLVPFNLGRAVLQKDPTQNLPLLPGDVVTILSQNDLRLPQGRQTRLVRVEGEVGAPGVYQTQAGETLVQLLQRIGGLTPQAYVFGTEVNRVSVRERQQANLAQLIRRLESQLQSQVGTVVTSQGNENAAQAQQAQQQQAQLRRQIDRLRSFQSNGRMALELDPLVSDISALPELQLEDGDRVLIPARPGFVVALGSVNNENVFIYKPGRTVADIIKLAGLTEDAEPSRAFVLRADGTIIARRDGSGFFGSGFESTEVMPGDTLVVPAQIDRETRYNFITRVLKDWTQIFANFGLGVAAINSL